MNIESLKSLVKSYPDFPKPGVLFRDISPILSNTEAFDYSIFEMYDYINSVCSELRNFKIAAIESRGFIFGSVLAHAFGVPLVLIRKAGKLPGDVTSKEYELEYGFSQLEVQNELVKEGNKFIIIDDVLATGGTALATANLLESFKNVSVLCMVFLLEITELGGSEKIKDYPVGSLIKF